MWILRRSISAPDGEPVLLVDERHVVDDEHPGLGDPLQLGPDALGIALPVAAAVERPGAAKRAVPGAPARELDRRRRVEHADEILSPLRQEIARRLERVQLAHHLGRRPLAGRGHEAREPDQRGGIAPRREHAREDLLALPPDDAIDRPFGVREDLRRRERGAVPADDEQHLGQPPARLLGEVDHLRNVGQVVDPERDGVGSPVFQRLEVVVMREDLQVEDANLMASLPGRRRHQLDPQRLETEIDLRVHEPGRMTAKDLQRPVRTHR